MHITDLLHPVISFFPLTNTVVKGTVLAGGNGTRLYPLTHVTNKHLLPVYDKPMIYYPIETLTRAGIRDIMIVTGKEHAGSFMNILGSGRQFSARFSYALQDKAGGIAEALSLTEEFVGDDIVLAILGDNIIMDEVKPYVEDFKGGAKVFLKKVTYPNRFGVPVFDDENRIVRIEEKPVTPGSNFAVTGLYLYDSTVFEKIRTLKPSSRAELEITDVNNLYLSEGKLSYRILQNEWLDAGTFDSLLEAANYMRNHKS